MNRPAEVTDASAEQAPTRRSPVAARAPRPEGEIPRARRPGPVEEPGPVENHEQQPRTGEDVARAGTEGVPGDTSGSRPEQGETEPDIVQSERVATAGPPGVGVLPHPGTSRSERLDRLSLQQALRDVEIANARVVDLTQRLVETRRELAQVRTHLSTVEATLVSTSERQAAVERSAAFRIARRIWALRSVFQR